MEEGDTAILMGESSPLESKSPLFVMEFSFAAENSEKVEIAVFDGDDPEQLANNIAASRGSASRGSLEIVEVLTRLIKGRIEDHSKIRPQSPSMIDSEKNISQNGSSVNNIQLIAEDDPELPADFVFSDLPSDFVDDRVSELSNSTHTIQVEILDLTKPFSESSEMFNKESDFNSEADRFAKSQKFWSGQKKESKNVSNLLSKLKSDSFVPPQQAQSDTFNNRPSKNRLFDQAKSMQKRKQARADAQKKTEDDELKSSRFKVKSLAISSLDVNTQLSSPKAQTRDQVFERFQLDIAQRTKKSEVRILESKQQRLEAELNPNWSCPRCTFENLHVATICKECAFSKPQASYIPTNVAEKLGVGIVNYDAINQSRTNSSVFNNLYSDTSIEDSRLKVAELVDQELLKIAPFQPVIPEESIRILKQKALRRSVSSPVSNHKHSDVGTAIVGSQCEKQSIYDKLHSESTLMKQRQAVLEHQFQPEPFTPSINETSRLMTTGMYSGAIAIEDKLIIDACKKKEKLDLLISNWHKIDHNTGLPLFCPDLQTSNGHDKQSKGSDINEKNVITNEEEEEEEECQSQLQTLKKSCNILNTVKSKFSKKVFSKLMTIFNENENGSVTDTSTDSLYVTEKLLSSIPSQFEEKYVCTKLNCLLSRSLSNHVTRISETEFISLFTLEMDKQPSFGEKRPYLVSSLAETAVDRIESVNQRRQLDLPALITSANLLRDRLSNVPVYQILIDKGKLYDKKKHALELLAKKTEMKECTFMPHMATK